MSYRLYWRRNDGVSGHVWLSTGDMDALSGEMSYRSFLLTKKACTSPVPKTLPE